MLLIKAIIFLSNKPIRTKIVIIIAQNQGNLNGSFFSPGGGYGWQVANPNLKGNSAFGDIYGINYVDG